MGDLDLNLLYILAALDQHRSVSGTALALNRSQPAISSALGKLRQYFDDPLFIRTDNMMQPTPRGVTLVQSARSILTRVDMDIIAAPMFEPSTSTCPVNLALSDVGEVIMLASIFRELRRLMPRAPIRSVSLPARSVAAELESGKIDLAIGYFPDLKKSTFYQQVLYFDTFASLIRTGHPVNTGLLSLKQYLGMDHMVVHAESRSVEVIERYLARKRIRRRVVLTTTHFASAPVIVAQSDLIVTIPEPLARYFSSIDANLRVVGLPFKPPRIALKQFWHRKVHHDARHRWLRLLMCRVFQEKSAGAKPGG
jgi:DNA-binding transcriptional LysR family regulator